MSTITYNGTQIGSVSNSTDLNIKYNGSVISTVTAGTTKTLQCSGKYMADDILIGSSLTMTANKILAHEQSGYVMDYSGYSVTDYIAVPSGCTSVTIDIGGVANGYDCLIEYNSSKSFLSFWGAAANPRTFNFDYPNDIKYIRVSCNTGNLANCYVRDNTHGTILFRGGYINPIKLLTSGKLMSGNVSVTYPVQTVTITITGKGNNDFNKIEIPQGSGTYYGLGTYTVTKGTKVRWNARGVGAYIGVITHNGSGTSSGTSGEWNYYDMPVNSNCTATYDYTNTWLKKQGVTAITGGK